MSMKTSLVLTRDIQYTLAFASLALMLQLVPALVTSPLLVGFLSDVVFHVTLTMSTVAAWSFASLFALCFMLNIPAEHPDAD